MPRVVVLLLLSALLVGCGRSRAVLTVEDRAALAAALTLDAMVGDAPPPPAPDEGGRCPNCTNPDGSPLFPEKPGHVGDGSVFILCNECGGTGKRRTAFYGEPAAPSPEPAAPAAAPPAGERYASPPRDGRVYRRVCRGGECFWEPIK